MKAAFIDARSHEIHRAVVCPGCCPALVRSGHAIRGPLCLDCWRERAFPGLLALAVMGGIFVALFAIEVLA